MVCAGPYLCTSVYSPDLFAWPLVLLSCEWFLIWAPLLQLWEPLIGTRTKQIEMRRWQQLESAGKQARITFFHVCLVRFLTSCLLKVTSHGNIKSRKKSHNGSITGLMPKLLILFSSHRRGVEEFFFCHRGFPRASSLTGAGFPSRTKTDFLNSRFCPSVAQRLSLRECAVQRKKKRKTASPVLFLLANHTHSFLSDQQWGRLSFHWTHFSFSSHQTVHVSTETCHCMTKKKS